MNKEIPAELLKQIEDEAVKRYPYYYEQSIFIEGAKYALSLSPSSGEGDLLAIDKALSEVRCDAPFDSNNSIEQAAFHGSRFVKVNDSITLGCISPEASDLLERIMSEWGKHEVDLKRKFNNHQPTIYAFAYWLCRWSGLIKGVQAPEATNTTEPGQGVKTAEEAIKKMDRAINSTYLEMHKTIGNSLRDMWNEVKKVLEQYRNQGTQSPEHKNN